MRKMIKLKTTRNLLVMLLVMTFCAVLTNEAQAQTRKKFKKKKTTAVTKVKAGKVLICNSKGAKTYHKKRCTGLARCKTKTTTLAVATARKTRKPCRICYPKTKR